MTRLAAMPTAEPTLLDEVVARLRELPQREQDRAAELILQIIERDRPDYQLTPEQVEIVRQTQEGLRDGTVKVLSEEEVEEMWRRLGV